MGSMQLAIVGLGFMGATHVKAALTIPNLKLAVVSRDPEKLKGDLSKVSGNLATTEAQLDFSSIKTFTTFDELLADSTIDAVDLCLPTALHEPFATKALAAGKHVLVEKPMGLDRAACDRMIEAATKANRILMAAQVLRFFPAYDSLKHFLSESGAIRTATFRRRCAAPGWGPWLKDKSQSGGGVFDLLIHDIDMALYLFGAPHSVSATGHEDLPNQIDVLNANLNYDGFTVNIAGGWHHGAFPFSMEFTLVAENGTIDFHSAQPNPTLYQANQPAKELTPDPPSDAYREEIAYFVDCARDNRPPKRCTPLSSAQAVSLAHLLLESRSKQGQTLSCQL
ncbi:MAG: Gfo/Idh/MocA family oxidoreductase [Acidobacteria bacterium]|nr:Gfo/Idh/MocA family oxidoreductase [Acidobacteriota bacterium]